ncbi:MAG: NADPH-dependent FMN reductase [Acidimicrobiales bacterium]|jgi:NAD(P)H-dependent FMN reductase
MDDSIRRIAVVIGSTRPNRICPGIAEWLRDAAQRSSPLRYELVDLQDINLPFLDEPFMAALGRYEHEHTREWSRIVSSFEGFIFVFPQYNWGYPGVLKNALDFLYAEWGGKPVSLATYGTRGGTRGARQLGEVLQGLHMNILEDHLEIVITEDDIDDEWQLLDLGAVMAPYVDQTLRIDAQMVEAIKNRPSVQ